MKTAEEHTGQAPATCAQIHRQTARTLRAIFANGSSFKDGCPTITRRLNIMARAAGINPAGYEIKDRWKLYLNAARALNRAGKLSDSVEAKQVQMAVANSLRWLQQRKEWKREQPAAANSVKTRTTEVGDNCEIYVCFDVRPGDKLELTGLTPAELRTGDLITLWDTNREKWAGVGRFTETGKQLWKEGDTAETAYVSILTAGGEEVEYPSPDYTPHLITAITRRIEIARGYSADVEQAQREIKIGLLCDRLDRLAEEDEITTCSARFKLEKQIYDLEHAPAHDEEWPEMIGGGA